MKDYTIVGLSQGKTLVLSGQCCCWQVAWPSDKCAKIVESLVQKFRRM